MSPLKLQGKVSPTPYLASCQVFCHYDEEVTDMHGKYLKCTSDFNFADVLRLLIFFIHGPT